MRCHDDRDFDDPLVINIHDKHVAERMPIHEARTSAELESYVVTHKTVVGKRWLRFRRIEERKSA